MSWIADDLYAKIHETMPIVCVDLAIKRDGAVLLVKRNEEPAKGKFWFPGGRIRRDETVAQAVSRIALEEVGLSVETERQIDYMDLRFKEDPFGHGKGTRAVSLVFSCRAVGGEVKLDERHGGHVWFAYESALSIPDMIQALAKKALHS